MRIHPGDLLLRVTDSTYYTVGQAYQVQDSGGPHYITDDDGDLEYLSELDMGDFEVIPSIAGIADFRLTSNTRTDGGPFTLTVETDRQGANYLSRLAETYKERSVQAEIRKKIDEHQRKVFEHEEAIAALKSRLKATN